MDAQRDVTAFIERHDLETPPAYRLLDLLSELGEVARNATESTDYGAAPDRIAVDDDEIGDALFALLALADSLDVDAGEALAESLATGPERADGRPRRAPIAGDPFICVAPGCAVWTRRTPRCSVSPG